MTYHIPLSSLLPPSSGAGPSSSLARSSAVLGPLPSTSPLHLARTFLETADLPEFDSNQLHPPARVLIITGKRSQWHASLLEEDEPWTRARIGDRRGLLRRVDIKYCPSPSHAHLLLNTIKTPAMVILWDLLQFDYNQLNDYIKLLATARSLETQLAVLEPRWTPAHSLAITPPGGQARRVDLAHAIRWVIGEVECHTDALGGHSIKQEPCESSPWHTSAPIQWTWQ